MKELKYIFIVCLIVSLAWGCGKEEEKYIIPGYPNFKIDINNLDATLRTPGAIKTFTSPRLANESVGYSGLIVVSSLIQEGGIVDLYAFDLCCPNEKRKEVIVTPSEIDGTATCNHCKSVFDLYTGLGNVKSGSSPHNLQRYRVSREGANGVFHIYR